VSTTAPIGRTALDAVLVIKPTSGLLLLACIAPHRTRGNPSLGQSNYTAWQRDLANRDVEALSLAPDHQFVCRNRSAQLVLATGRQWRSIIVSLPFRLIRFLFCIQLPLAAVLGFSSVRDDAIWLSLHLHLLAGHVEPVHSQNRGRSKN
jgi:hypothetical protein